MKPGLVVSMVFEPDPGLGPDPLDVTAQEPRRLGHVFTGSDDFVVIHREWGEQFEGGSRTHLWKNGIWEHLELDDIVRLLEGQGDES